MRGESMKGKSKKSTYSTTFGVDPVSAGEWFVYAEPKVSYDAGNGVYELRVKKTPCI